MYSFTAYFFFICFVNYAKTHESEKVAAYDGAQVWQTKLNDDQGISNIIKLVDTGVISLWNLQQYQADFLVQSEDKVKVNRILNAHNLNHSVLVMDVQRRIDSMKVEPATWNEDTLRIGHRLNWKAYPTLKIVEEYYTYIAENFPSICNVSTIGYTSENRSIKMVKISNGNPNNKALLITGGMHAREWSAITSTLYVLDKVVSKFDQMPSYMKIFDWTFIPILNPDGYVYTHTKDRLWRKNRRKLQICKGVDINRNFDIDWDVARITDRNECFESYAGPRAFSEAESQALRDVILSTKRKPLAMLDIHAYGPLILYPWSARASPTPDRRLLWTSAKTMSESIYNHTGANYKFGAVYHMVYPATGAAIDWMYFTGVVLSFGVEVGEKGGHGFLMPPENIEPTGKELLVAVKELLKNLDPELIKKRGLGLTWF